MIDNVSSYYKLHFLVSLHGFDLLPEILNFPLLGAGHFCISVHILGFPFRVAGALVLWILLQRFARLDPGSSGFGTVQS